MPSFKIIIYSINLKDSMDFQRMGIDADAMAKFVQDRTDLHVNFI